MPAPKPRPSAAVTPGADDSASAAVAPGRSGSGQLESRAGAREEGQDFADGGFLGGGFGQREVRLDLAAVAAAVVRLDHVAGSGQAGADAAGAALGDARAGRDVALLRARWRAMRSSARAWLVRKLQLATLKNRVTDSRNILLVFFRISKLSTGDGDSRQGRPAGTAPPEKRRW